MKEYLIDLKASAAFFGFSVVSFSEVDIVMKIVSFLLMSSFVLRRWYLMEQNKKE
ncbi:hypothetical protein ACM55G_14770 [Flavobacterium sp. LB3P122]|uniref:hypothetical protein n=1 Tax=Flavobacterium algoriphilum TaxID=3398738 RepID=UPI003A841D3A